jgi:DinB superfamily
MTAQELLAEQIERIGDSLAHYLETTAPDRLNWQPQLPDSAPTRSALEQAAECIAVNRTFAALLRGDATVSTLADEATPADTAEARTRLQASCAALADVIRNTDDALLDAPFQTTRGQRSGRGLMVGAYRNMAYHCGQINFIQILAGDAQFHVPATWL